MRLGGAGAQSNVRETSKLVGRPKNSSKCCRKPEELPEPTPPRVGPHENTVP